MVVLEAIGLALGVAPLIVELLKAKPQPIHALKASKSENAKEMAEDFYRTLQFEVTMLNLSLTRLVNELPVKAELKHKLTDNSSLDAMVWKKPSPELQSALAQRLNPCSEPFTHSMEKILSLLAKLVDDKSLPLPIAKDQVRVCKNTSYAKLEDFFDTRLSATKKLRFGWNKEKRDKMMKGITKYNLRLTKMLNRTSEARSGYIVRQQKTTRTSTPHLGLRQKMVDLRRAISRVWCKCTGKHELRFALSKTWKSEEHVSMAMIMNLSEESDKWLWGESKISINLAELKGYQSLKAVTYPPTFYTTEKHARRHSSNFTGATLVQSPGGSPRSEFSDAPSPIPSVSIISVDDEKEKEADSRTRSNSHHGRISVHNICATVKQCRNLRKASLLIFDQDMLWHNSTTADSELDSSDSGMFLHDALKEGRLSMKGKKILQVLLAQSVLFFPWDGRRLNKESITFHEDLSKPFAAFVPYHEDEEKTPQNTNELVEFNAYNNETLAALAILLLEIELGKRIEELEIEEDLGESVSRTFTTSFWTTTRVLEDHADNIYKGCYEAIDACLRCDFGAEGPATLDDPGFLQEVYNRIVAPLEQELWNGFELRMPYFGIPDSGSEDMKSRVVPKLGPAIRPPRSTQKKSVTIFQDYYEIEGR